MKFFNKAAVIFALLMISQGCFLKAERDNVNDPKSDSYSITASVTPGSGATITGHEPITVTFNDSMDTSSVEAGIGGDIIKANCKFTWTQTTYQNDTLTISLKDAATAAFWPKGSGRTLTIDGETLYGEVLSTVTVTFNIDYIVYVKTQAEGGDDVTNLGTSGAPVATIQKGISLASVIYAGSTSKVYVAQGTYQSNYYATGNPVINMVEGISVYGGYSPTDWSQRNISTYVTTVEDTSTSGGGDYTSANCGVKINSGITNTSVLDGFTIRTANLGHSTGVFCDSSSPIISNNSIVGSANTDGSGYIYGIISNNATPTINNNTIFYQWNNNKGAESYGIYVLGGIPVISSNYIYGGKAVITTAIYDGIGATITGNTIYGNTSALVTGNTNSYGVYIDYSSPSIENNLRIDCGSGSNIAVSVYISGTSTPEINSNVISNINKTTDIAIGIYESDIDSDPASVTGNDFDGIFGDGATKTGYYYDEGINIIINLSTNIINTSTNTLSGWSNVSTFNSSTLK